MRGSADGVASGDLGSVGYEGIVVWRSKSGESKEAEKTAEDTELHLNGFFTVVEKGTAIAAKEGKQKSRDAMKALRAWRVSCLLSNAGEPCTFLDKAVLGRLSAGVAGD